MKLFNNKIIFEIGENLPTIIEILNKSHETIKVTIDSYEFEAIERSGYFKASHIKDYKFSGKILYISSKSTEMRMNIKLSKIGKINLSIIGFFILYGFTASILAFSDGHIKAFLIILFVTILSTWYTYFRLNRSAINSSILLLNKLKIPIDKIEIKNFS